MRVVVLSVVTVLVVVTAVLGTRIAKYVVSTLRKITCNSEVVIAQIRKVRDQMRVIKLKRDLEKEALESFRKQKLMSR